MGAYDDVKKLLVEATEEEEKKLAEFGPQEMATHLRSLLSTGQETFRQIGEARQGLNAIEDAADVLVNERFMVLLNAARRDYAGTFSPEKLQKVVDALSEGVQMIRDGWFKKLKGGLMALNEIAGDIEKITGEVDEPYEYP